MEQKVEKIDFDLYVFLDIADDASKEDIIKAFRQKAKRCHPDKQPEDKKKFAEEEFHKAARALEVLTDNGARAAYDRRRKARKANEERLHQISAKRRKLKEELDMREQVGQVKKQDELQAHQRLQAEIERLRTEGTKLLQQEKEACENAKIAERKQGPKTSTPSSSTVHEPARLRLRWSVASNDQSNAGYSEQVLRLLFEKYGDVSAIVISGKKQGSALIEFASPYCAEAAYEFEHGIPNRPIKISWVCGQPVVPEDETGTNAGRSASFDYISKADTPPPRNVEPNTLSTERDFESIVLMKMRQEDERRKLIQQMLLEDS